MRHRVALLYSLYGFLVFLALGLVLYSPVLVAWSNRTEEPMPPEYAQIIVYNRTAEVRVNWCTRMLPGIYRALLRFHAEASGWVELGLTADKSTLVFIPDTAANREFVKQQDKSLEPQ